eukprot:COSAG05_NODE_1969_length_3768_cov_5.081221_3_plen_82_part_00
MLAAAAAAAVVVVVAVVVAATGDLAARAHREVLFPAWQVGEEVGMVGRADELSEEAVPDLVVTEEVIVDDSSSSNRRSDSR